MTIMVSAVNENLNGILKINGSIDGINTRVGNSIKLEVTASGGNSGYTYKYVVHNLDSNIWYTLKDYCDSETYTTRISSTGNKEFVVSIMDKLGNKISTNKIVVKSKK